jgi:transcriptional/translational regulatory protein YebC/TACO1
MNLIEAVEEDEDVSEVHTNAEIGEGVATQL